MSRPPVSVIVVSRGRPHLLRRCLTGLSQLLYRPVEVIVVADAPGLRALAAHRMAREVQAIACDEANISLARNLGIAAAAGEICAFIDDDAVPEPTWLDHLAAPFADPAIGAAGGFVRGRNGISFQWRARAVNALGATRDLPVPGAEPFTPALTPGWAVKTEGTNMAVRRDALVAAGGFDQGFRFFLDETDLNLRLAALGWGTVLVPMAQVHHGFAASARRRADRVPTDLHEIGASTALFLVKHAGPDRETGLARLRADQRVRAVRLLVAGRIEPRDMRRLLAGLERGIAEGLERQPLPRAFGQPPQVFRGLTRPPPGGAVVIAGRRGQRRQLDAAARRALAQGLVPTVICLSRSAAYHRAWFSPEGIWWQAGGLWGRAERSDPIFRPWRRAARVASEARALAGLRWPAAHPPKLEAP